MKKVFQAEKKSVETTQFLIGESRQEMGQEVWRPEQVASNHREREGQY